MKNPKLSNNPKRKTLNHSKTPSVFKPLIASSLALSLISFTYADSQKPIIKYDTNGDISSTIDINWNGLDGGSSGKWQPTFHSQQTTPINLLVLGFSSQSPNTSSQRLDARLTDNFTLSTINQIAIQIGNMDSLGKLVVRMEKANNQNKTATIDLRGKDTAGYSLYGDFEVWNPAQSSNNSSAQITVNLSGSIKGSVRDYYTGGESVYSFQNNSNIEGDLRLEGNSKTFTFGENASSRNKITQNIFLGSNTNSSLIFKGIGEIGGSIQIGSYTSGKITIDFQQANSRVSGNIVKNGRNNTNDNRENIITFKQHGDVDGSIIANRPGGHRDAKVDARLTVEFGKNGNTNGNSSITNTVKGSVQANVAWANAYWGINARTNVLFYNKGVIERGVQASQSNSGSGINTITFYRDGTINGSISSNGGSNTIKFENTSGDGAETTNNQISATISANGGSNTISFNRNNGTSTNIISGNISANGGSNIISFNGATSVNQMTGNITVGSGGALGNNKILFKGSSTTFGTNDRKVNIRSTQTNGNRTDKENLIKFSSTTNTLIIDTMYSSITTGNGGSGIARNVLSLDGGTSTVSINTIEAGSAGYNYVGKEFLNGEDSSAGDLSFKNSGAVFNGNISINSIIARGGTNIIKVNSTRMSNLIFDSTGKRIDSRNTGNSIGTITANGGTNDLTLQGVSTISGNIVVNGGTNKITFDGSGSTNTISGNLDAQRNLNNITFNGSSSTNTISGNITASGGTNKITFSGSSSTNKIGQDTSGVSIASTGGTNKIILNASGTANNTLSLNSVTATGGKNSIGKDDLSNVADGGFTFNSSNGIASQAFEGTLKITEGIKGSDGGWNNIAFKAKNGQTTPVISNTSGNAAEGNMNLYLDMSAITPTNETNPTIKGNVSNGSNGQVNIYIKGKTNGSTTSDTLGLAGNITTNGGTTGIIFEDAIWAPTNPESLKPSARQGEEVTPPTSGVLTAQGNGKTTIILRKSSSASTGNQADNKVPLFQINNDGTGEVNIVLQGPVNIGSNLNYKNGKTNLVFAGSNDSANDNFHYSTATASSSNKFLGKTYQDGVKLELADKMVKVVGQEENKSFIDTYGEIFKKANDGSLLTVKTSRVNDDATRGERATQTDTVSISGLAIGNISELAPSTSGGSIAYNYNVTLEQGAAFVGSMSLQENSKINLVLKQGAKLLTDSPHLKIQTLTLGNGSNGGLTYDSTQLLNNTFDQTNTVIDLVTMGNDFTGFVDNRKDFRLLEVGTASGSAGVVTQTGTSGLKGGNGLFRVYMNASADQGSANSNSGASLGGTSDGNYSNNGTGQHGHIYSDRILIHEGNGATSGAGLKPNYIQVIADANTNLSSIKYYGGGTEIKGNIAVATVKGANGSQVATFEGAAQRQGFDIIGTTLEAVSGTDAGGKTNGSTAGTGNDYTTYFVSSMESRGVASTDQQASASALGLNYEIFLANFNSLNKRMGELRNNDHSQGAWGRIFNGMLESSYGLQTKSLYTTIQAGYDYAFGFEGANNYVGIALSYANAIVDPKSTFDEFGKVGIDKANQHAVEIAIYNSYVQDEGWFNDTIAKFSYMMNSINMMNQSSNYSVNNFGVVFSDEFGYRFKLGEEKEWFIDPQAEVGFGYFDQSKLKQVLGDYSLDGVQDHIMTLRSRVGVNWGYDFKKFTEGKDIGASLYVGTYYTYDYITGGEINLTSNFGSKVKTNVLNSTGRFDLNVGTNISIKDNTRLYVDFERSFGGDITTVYQVNLGVRYSFGEGNYTPVVQKANAREEFAPLKLQQDQGSETADTQDAQTQGAQAQ